MAREVRDVVGSIEFDPSNATALWRRVWPPAFDLAGMTKFQSLENNKQSMQAVYFCAGARSVMCGLL